jgi:putative membrane protein
LLLSYPLREVLVRLGRARGIWAYVFPIDMVLGFSALYEIMEWLAADRVSPELGLAFLGAQGDVWDAQKDMAMAGLGVVLAMSIVFVTRAVLDKNHWKELRASIRVPAHDTPLGEVWIEHQLEK